MSEIASVPHVRINWFSQYAPHVMTLTTRPPSSPVVGAVPNYEAWDASPISGNVMVENFVDEFIKNIPATSTVVSYEVYDAPDAELPPVWLYSAFLAGKVGTLVEDGEAKAVQYTMSFRCSDGGLLKVVTLDTPVDGFFGNINGLSARDGGIAAEILDGGNAWSGKKGGQPLAFSNITVSLNKRLRRKYDMV